MEIKNFRAVNHPTIKANFNVYLEPWDLYLNKMVLIQTSKGTFVSAPSEKYEKGGETKYFPYFGFGKERNKTFQGKVLEALKPHLATTTTSQSEQGQESNDNDLPF